MAKDKTTFEGCKAIVTEGLATFVEIGEALRTIRDNKWYKETHETFEAFCRDEWEEMSRTRAYELMTASEVFENVRHAGHKPNARQATELAKLPPEQQAEV